VRVRFIKHVADAVLLDLVHTGVDLLLGRRGLVGRREIVDGDVGPVRGEADGDRLADAGRAARDEDVLALQAGKLPRRTVGRDWCS
jgi:hypothetical protein